MTDSAASPTFISPPPLSVYIHVPWCIKKCPYCDFNSHAHAGNLPEVAYVDQLISDLKQDRAWAADRPLVSIFIGGGTPSLLSSRAIERILNACDSMLSITDETEITMEWNPGSASRAASSKKLREIRSSGINRLSIGVQSFDDASLKRIGRIHSAHDAHSIIESAYEAGFDNINVDLMYGLPDQSTDMALADLKTASELPVQHLSWYQLTVEPNTYFHSFPPPLPGDEQIWQVEKQGLSFLKDCFQRYEISAYAKPLKQSQHNRNYWEFGDYIGLGAGAHGKITDLEVQGVFRTSKQRQPDNYMVDIRRAISAVTAEDLKVEFMLNALRLTDGVPRHLYTDRTGLAPSTIDAFVANASSKGLLRDDATLQPTAKGLRYLNDLLQLVLP